MTNVISPDWNSVVLIDPSGRHVWQVVNNFYNNDSVLGWCFQMLNPFYTDGERLRVESKCDWQAGWERQILASRGWWWWRWGESETESLTLSFPKFLANISYALVLCKNGVLYNSFSFILYTFFPVSPFPLFSFYTHAAWSCQKWLVKHNTVVLHITAVQRVTHRIGFDDRKNFPSITHPFCGFTK